MSRPDRHIPEESLREELMLKRGKVRDLDQVSSTLSYRLMITRMEYLAGSEVMHLRPYFAQLDMEDALVRALAASPLYTELLDRVDAIVAELKEREMDRQDEVAA